MATQERYGFSVIDARPSWRLTRAVAILGLLLAPACASDPADTLDEQTFIDVIVELREADREVRADSLPEDSAVAAFEARRDSILDHYGVTPDQLRRFAERGVADLERMTEIWDTISQRLKHVPGRPAADSVAAADSVDAPDAPPTRQPRVRPTDAPPRPTSGRPDTLRS